MITVCIPAYQAGAFIGETVSSVLAQSFDDFRIEIAIDPSEGDKDSTEAALEPFRDDPRVNISTNPRRLGWAGNFNALLQRVETPFYAPLPHDDIWASDYLATFFPLVSEHPKASVAYGDMTMFDANGITGFRSVALPQGEDRMTHLIRFMVQGAHAMPWRGVTRQSAIAVTQGFPTDLWGGFAVEAEYALGLLEAGPVIHVPKALYRKRVFQPQERMSASKARTIDWAVEDRLNAWKRHCHALEVRMRRMMSTFKTTSHEVFLAELAFRAAMLMRRHSFVTPGLDKAELASLASLRSYLPSIDHPLTPCVAEQLRWFDRAAQSRTE
ncbi:glycosyltransferase [Roseovarius mucosus]|uniref:glycosyltransferase family 2 protein n=1 Tax=Roseovarius mucosus TaxID=215743 RepID=UPI001C5CEEBD|nr:glycosyltransferase [Roseovarius mucosus]MBW4973117.1 glycosyltransferase [Roseovarius mucosus]